MATVEDGAENFVEGAVLVGKLELLLMQEYQLLSGLRGQVALPRDDAAMMNAQHRLFSEANKGSEDRSLWEWMKLVRELSYDVEDCIDLFVGRISWASWVGRVWHRFVTIRPQHRLATEIEHLHARAVAIGGRSMRYSVYGQALQPSVAFGSRHVPTSSVPPPVQGVANDDPSQFVGMAERIRSLSRDVNSGDSDLALKVHAIVGIGGVGKTTLAVAVCRNLKAAFPKQALLSVRQHFDASKGLDGIEELEGKRYLMVIDDVWTISEWNTICLRLPRNNMGSRVIVTTRNEAVAVGCSSGGEYIYQALVLNERDSKSLFVRRVFGQKVPLQSAPSARAHADPSSVGRTSVVETPSSSSSTSVLKEHICLDELEDKMETILKKCGGLPSAIVCIASVLARYNSSRSVAMGMWTRVCNSIGYPLEANSALLGMMDIIALSYNHLSHHLKSCAMVLSIFPPGYQIQKPKLLRRWITEGLIPEKRGMTSLDVAEAYCDKLLSRNLIQHGVGLDGALSGIHYSVHDMMHEVIVSKSIEANFVSLVGGLDGGTSYDLVRRLSIHVDVGYVGEQRSMQHVRSLSSFCAKINNSPGKLLDRITKFTLLRVLDLEDCKDLTNKHLKQVCRLFLLRLLNLNGTDITELPSEISNLKHLQILWLWDALLNEVPGSVINLEKLEHMSFRNRDKPDSIYLRLPRGLKKMKALQQLTRLQIGKDDAELAEELGDLVQLRVLGVFVLWGHTAEVDEVLQNSFDKLKLCSLRGEPYIEYQKEPAAQVPAEDVTTS